MAVTDTSATPAPTVTLFTDSMKRPWVVVDFHDGTENPRKMLSMEDALKMTEQILHAARAARE